MEADIDHIESHHGNSKTYWLGFILSVVLTLAAYFLVSYHAFSKNVLIYTIIGLAIVQFVVQLVLFLHLGDEPKPRWNMTTFLFMAMVVVIIVFGSLWIMFVLDDRVMPSTQMPKSMHYQE